MNRPRVLLADDHIIVSQGLQSLLEGEFDVVGSVTDGCALVDAAKRLKPDAIVADISMPIMNGIDAVRQLRREGQTAKVVFLTMHTDPQIALEAFRAGATGYVLKQSAGDELIAAIHTSLEGGTHLTPAVAEEMRQLLLISISGPEQEVVQHIRHHVKSGP